MEGNDTDRLSISINSNIQEHLHKRYYKDLDRFGFRLSVEISSMLGKGHVLPRAVQESVSKIETTFFRLNGLKRGAFADDALIALRHVKVTQGELQNELLAFKILAESQFVHNLLKDPSEENVRSLLQAFLGHGYLTRREVDTGRGQMDILVVTGNPKGEVIETKVWGGQTYYDDGLVELATYLKTEQLSKGYYVVLELGGADYLINKKGKETWLEEVHGKTIQVVFIRVPAVVPSRLGRARRRQARDE